MQAECHSHKFPLAGPASNQEARVRERGAELRDECRPASSASARPPARPAPIVWAARGRPEEHANEAWLGRFFGRSASRPQFAAEQPEKGARVGGPARELAADAPNKWTGSRAGLMGVTGIKWLSNGARLWIVCRARSLSFSPLWLAKRPGGKIIWNLGQGGAGVASEEAKRRLREARAAT